MATVLHHRTSVSLVKSYDAARRDSARAGSKEYRDDDLAPFTPFSGRLPPNYRRIRLIAFSGWATALVLFCFLYSSNPSLKGIDISTLYAQDGVEKAVAPVPKGGVSSRVTIVSGFYRIDSGKKHKVSEYNIWLSNFLSNVELPIVFYCAPSMRAQVAELRGDKPITIISNFETPFEMPPLQNLGGYEWALAQHKIDPENQLHVPDLYGIWTAKPWIVRQARETNPYLSEYFFWTDAGSFRDANVKHTFTGLAAALDVIYDKVPDDTLILSAVEVPLEKGTDYVKSVRREGIMDRKDILQGGWYGGKGGRCRLVGGRTMKVTVLQAALQRFSAKEQPVWTHAARLNWERIYVQNMRWREGDCGPDMWFGFEYFADGRDCRVPAWVGPVYAKLEDVGKIGSGTKPPLDQTLLVDSR